MSPCWGYHVDGQLAVTYVTLLGLPGRRAVAVTVTDAVELPYANSSMASEQ